MSSHTIHHVTAVTADVRQNLRYYTETLGLRLVKKSVNQDDVSAYHLFYADAAGSPGTDMTFFDWPNMGPVVPGAATVALTSFAVPAGSLSWWEERLADSHVLRESDEEDNESLLFTDPEGQRLELVELGHGTTPHQPWTAVVPEDKAILGIMGVTLESARPDSTRRVLHELLGYRSAEGEFFEAADEEHYARIRVLESLRGRMGRVGAGGVHHVAFRVSDDDELQKLMERVESAGLQTSGFVDRFYFHSVYFREPGGVLFELATDGPGFASDEDASTLGEKLALPPFLEDQRETIEAGLKPLTA